MLRSVMFSRSLMPVVVCCAFAVPALSQERGEVVFGKVTSINGATVTVHRDNGPDVRIRVTPQTEVYFRDAGDRRLFPNPTSNDLRVGMDLEFTYGSGTPDKLTVHFVPEGTSATPTWRSGAGQGQGPRERPTQLKARVQSIRRDRLEADVAGRSESFRIEGSRATASVRSGDLVVITVENRGGERVVTDIESAAVSGVITRLEPRSRSVSIEVDGRESTYRVEDRRQLEDLREGDRVRFEFEERPDGSRVVTRFQPRR
jgi:hypothetical protein